MLNIRNADGSEPIEKCRVNREWLIHYYQFDAELALRYFSDKYAADKRADNKFSVTKDNEHVLHVRKCLACTAWIEFIVGPKLMRRQSRLVQYCCTGLFVLIEEPGKLRSKPVIQPYKENGRVLPRNLPGTEIENRFSGDLRLELQQRRVRQGGLITKIEIYCDDKRAAEFQINYCPSCGQRLKFPEQVTQDGSGLHI